MRVNGHEYTVGQLLLELVCNSAVVCRMVEQWITRNPVGGKTAELTALSAMARGLLDYTHAIYVRHLDVGAQEFLMYAEECGVKAITQELEAMADVGERLSADPDMPGEWFQELAREVHARIARRLKKLMGEFRG